MSFMLIILGAIDIIAGIVLTLTGIVSFADNQLVFILAIIFILKSLYSLVTAMAAGFFFDVLGWFDLFAGFILLLATWEITFGFVIWIGIIMIIKGIYSIVMGLVA
ncbi:MAG: hypothetical protein KKA90_03585 [Nanoarchaeota archaeon]|nr:hypothetical protein [Nanoarchaeota archaeon]